MWEEIRQADSGAGTKVPDENRKEEKQDRSQRPSDTATRPREQDFRGTRSEIHGKERDNQKPESSED
jgi:hypothetical protein